MYNDYSSNDPTAAFGRTFFFVVVIAISVFIWLCAGGFNKQLPPADANSGTASAYAAGGGTTPFFSGRRGSYLGLGRIIGRSVFHVR